MWLCPWLVPDAIQSRTAKIPSDFFPQGKGRIGLSRDGEPAKSHLYQHFQSSFSQSTIFIYGINDIHSSTRTWPSLTCSSARPTCTTKAKTTTKFLPLVPRLPASPLHTQIQATDGFLVSWLPTLARFVTLFLPAQVS